MQYELKYTKTFRRSYKRAKNEGWTCRSLVKLSKCFAAAKNYPKSIQIIGSRGTIPNVANAISNPIGF